jgi:hypothetical protein
MLIQNGYSESQPDVDSGCGSMFCVYSLLDQRFMIEWDGEEGFGAVQKWIGDGHWNMLEPIVLEGALEDFNKSLDDLLSTIKAVL